jgi:hypothetical protein
LKLISKIEDSKNKIELLKLLNLGLGTGFKKNQTGTGSGFDFFPHFRLCIISKSIYGNQKYLQFYVKNAQNRIKKH